MSIHPSSLTQINKAPVAINLDCQRPLRITIHWIVSRRAIASISPTLVPQGTNQMLRLEYRINSNQAASWVLIDPKSKGEHTIDRPASPATITQSQKMTHIESSELRASIENEPAELIYVRTTIFQDLNIPGGRYHPSGVAVSVS